MVATLREVSGGELVDGTVSAVPEEKIRGVVRLRPDTADQYEDRHVFRGGSILCSVAVRLESGVWATAYQKRAELRPVAGGDEWEAEIDFLIPIVDPPRSVELRCDAQFDIGKKNIGSREVTIVKLAAAPN